MKKPRYISNKATQALLGLLIAVFLLLQPAYYELTPQPNADQKETSSTKKEQEKTQQLSLADAVPSPSTHIDYAPQLFLLEELETEKEEVKKPSAGQIHVSLYKALKVLLRQIISPNAP